MNKKYKYFIVIFLIITSFIAYGRILNNGFVICYDDQYITQNDHIKSGINFESIKWAFTSVVAGNWHSLTLFSHMLDWSLFGANSGGHHIVSLLLHIGAVIFLFLFLNKTTNNIWSSSFAAAIFALHPLRVESVAWAAERKDVLSLFLGMACLYAYAFYTENYKLSKYFICFGLFVLSLMSNPLLVTLPFVLLLLDYWPLGRWTKCEFSNHNNSTVRLIGEKIPFVFLTVIISVVTLWAQNKDGAFAYMEQIPFPARLAHDMISCVTYLRKIFWPVDLAVFYPYEYPSSLSPITVSFFVLTGITVFVIYYIKKLPFLFTGWFWYLGTIIPVIGLLQVDTQPVADHHTYLPSIGVAIMLAWAIPLLFQREEIRKKVLFPASIAVLCLLAVLTWKQCGYWKNSIELFSHSLEVMEDNRLAHSMLAIALLAEGKNEEAIDHYNQVIIMTSHSALPYHMRGNAYAKLGQYNLAIEDYKKAIRLQPDYILAYYDRGIAYSKTGHYQLAIEDYSEIIRLKSDYVEAYNNRSAVYLTQGNMRLGCLDACKACELGNCKILELSKRNGDCN